ncbi:MFS transporter [Paenibacillus sp. KN14-4R]|uniref:MFS transporter n=1 Tax=Paenibacillus sp. KN14-4R TaxID=3445773 RepID=UPI003FA00467
MFTKKLLETWKYASILLIGIGVSNIGAWIYLIALNLMVLNMTESVLAVAALYILRPLASIFTNLWSGSLIDRLNKRNLMVFLDISRAILIAMLPLFSSLGYIFTLVLVINMASTIFGPTSMTYITKLIPTHQRQRFNSLNSLISSGAFLIGPAIAGMLFLIGSPVFAIYINAIALLISGLLTLIMPNLEKDTLAQKQGSKLSIHLLKKDWGAVLQFYRQKKYVLIICLLFSFVMVVMTSSVDSLEASFAKMVLHLSEGEYGVLVSVAGAGIIVGALLNTLIVKKVATSVMISGGSIGMCLGYIIFAFSHSFMMAAVGFFILAFFIAFANTGFMTFYQNNIPVDVMGRVGSMNQFIEAILKIITTAALGLAADLISIQVVVIVGVLIMFGFGLVLCGFTLQRSKSAFF